MCLAELTKVSLNESLNDSSIILPIRFRRIGNYEREWNQIRGQNYHGSLTHIPCDRGNTRLRDEMRQQTHRSTCPVELFRESGPPASYWDLDLKNKCAGQSEQQSLEPKRGIGTVTPFCLLIDCDTLHSLALGRASTRISLQEG